MSQKAKKQGTTLEQYPVLLCITEQLSALLFKVLQYIFRDRLNTSALQIP